MAQRGRMARATSGYRRLDALKALARKLAEELDNCMDQKTVAGLARQYRETMAEIDAIESGVDDEDEVSAIIQRNRESGADAVRDS